MTSQRILQPSYLTTRTEAYPLQVGATQPGLVIGIVAGDWQTSSFCWQLLIWATNVYHQTHSNVHLKVAIMRVYNLH